MKNIYDWPVVILCGGKGSRLIDYTKLLPKALVTINDIPIVVRIIRHYYSYGFKNFILAAGHKKEELNKYFINYKYYFSNLDIGNDGIKILNKKTENWNIKIIDTGKDTETGGRILNLKQYLLKHDSFLLTYGDGIADINIDKLIKSHKKKKKICTLSIRQSHDRFGTIELKNNIVESFSEKKSNWTNIGFMVFNKQIFKYIKNNKTNLEKHVLNKLAKIKELNVFKHNAFWRAMDTTKDKIELEKLIK
jgi:glucose-1-phosphate cytidylyltransferase